MVQVRTAEFLASASSYGQLPPPVYAEIAFGGRSNVGKSSLINNLVQRKKLVRTSSTPGCTRGINLFRIEVVDPPATMDLVDLPGYGFARRSKKERRSWGPLIETFLSQRPGLRGLVVIIDARRGLQTEDEELLDFLKAIDRPALLVATKIDKIQKSKRQSEINKLKQRITQPVFPYSSAETVGREALWRALFRMADVSSGDAIPKVAQAPSALPAESAPTESAPAESAPTESAPAESAPVESVPTASAPTETPK